MGVQVNKFFLRCFFLRHDRHYTKRCSLGYIDRFRIMEHHISRLFIFLFLGVYHEKVFVYIFGVVFLLGAGICASPSPPPRLARRRLPSPPLLASAAVGVYCSCDSALLSPAGVLHSATPAMHGMESVLGAVGVSPRLAVPGLVNRRFSLFPHVSARGNFFVSGQNA